MDWLVSAGRRDHLRVLVLVDCFRYCCDPKEFVVEGRHVLLLLVQFSSKGEPRFGGAGPWLFWMRRVQVYQVCEGGWGG